MITVFISENSQKESRYLPSPVYRCRVQWIQIKTDFNLNNVHYGDFVSSFSSVKKFTSKCYQSVGCYLNLVSFSLFDRRHSDKREKILKYIAYFWRLPMYIA